MTDWNPVVNELFAKAIELESPEQQRALLDSACGEDSDLRAGVERLLKAHNDAGSFLNKPPDGLAPTITTGENDTVDASDTDFSLDFLTPTDKPNCLGTLGQYEAIEVVGRGGMGIVLRAYDTRLNRVVAIKVMAPELAVNPMAVKRFLREARAAAAVSHEHVVTIHAIEEDNKPPFIVMEYVDGKSLQQKVDEAGSLEVKEILRIGMQTARGLAAAHEQGLIHRDIKPANILLENGIERVQLTDFGLARATDDVSVTQTGQIAGTPQYMSPEQAEGKWLDSRSDLFSLGSVLYTLCTGRAPFRAESAVAMLRRVTEETPRPIGEINDEIPGWLEAIIGKLLAKNPDERFYSADEVANLLGQHLAHVQDPQTAPMPAPVEPPDKVGGGDSELSLNDLFLWIALPIIVCFVLVFRPVYRFLTAHTGGTVNVQSDDESVVIRFSHILNETSDGSVTVMPSETVEHKGSGTVELPAGRYSVSFGDRRDEFSMNHSFFTLGVNHQIKLLVRRRRGPSMRMERRFAGHTGTVTAVDISPDGKHALSASGWPNGDGTLRLWDLSSATEIRQFKGHDCPIVRAFYSPDGKRIIAGGTNRDAFVYDVETAGLVGALRGFKSDFRHGIALLPDGEHALIGEGVGSVHICKIDSGEVVHTLKQPDDRVMAIAVSPDGKRALATSGDEVYVWDLEARQQIGRFRQHSELVQSVAFSHDGKRAVSASIDKTARVWEVATQEQIQVLRGHTAGVLSARFTFDDRRVVSGSHDETIRVWDATNGKQLYEAKTSRQSVWSVAVTPDGKRILSGGGQHDKTDRYRLKEFDLRLWQIPESDATTLQQQAARVAAEAWLKLVDSGQYAEAWEACAKETRKADDKQTLVTTYTQLFQSIGKLESRQLLTNRYALEQATEFVNVQYDTQFAAKRVTETVALIREDDGTWRVSGYFHAPRIVASSPFQGNAGILANPPSLPTAGLPTGKNLILDSSLEETRLGRLPKSWFAWLDDGPDFKCEVVEGGVTGKHCLQISGTGTRGVVFATSIPMDRSKRYALKGHVKVEGDANTWAVIKLNYFNKNGWLGVDDRVGMKSGESGWQFFEKTDRANAFPEATLLVPTCHIEGSGTAWFDDLEVVAYDHEHLPEDFDKKHGKNNRMYSLE